MTSFGWTTASAMLDLLSRTVHVWRADLAQLADSLPDCERLLSPAETERAARFVGERPRAAYVAGRAMLRSLLAGYLETPAARLAFVDGQHGKPALLSQTGLVDLRFNLSHSGEVLLLAVAEGCEVGCDVEQVRAMDDLIDVARRAFPPAYVARLLAHPAAEQSDVFFQCWTHKEALLKAHGEVLAASLDWREDCAGPGRATHVRSVLNGSDTGLWEIFDLELGSGYAGAVAVAGEGWSIRDWQWQGLNRARA